MMRQTLLTTALAMAVSALPALPALAAPGDGRVTVRPVGVAADAAQDANRVCRFYLEATGFQGSHTLRYRVERERSSSTVIVSGTIRLRDGSGSSGVIRVPDGEYSLTWNAFGSSSDAGEKKITVDCKGTAAGSQSGSQSGADQQATGTSTRDEGFLDLSRLP
ncbi:hypothetical protein [Thermomonospora catenispora]|uniref:hypothetical protein n=1 Tax=Thermomonospora catenispora TaxID=2493090 RepID=UPI0011208745|nr:hypothetical protein [Thermomonospora catenispora]TNY34937.1 hypothetical protein EIO00_21365 [Thermomonospora catenispora]